MKRMKSMKNYRKIIIISILAFMIVGLSAGAVSGQSEYENEEKQYRKLLKTVDGIIRTVRLKNDVTENGIIRLENNYETVFEEEFDRQNYNLSPSSLNGEKTDGVEKMTQVKKDIIEKAESEGIELSFIYNYSILIILGVSLGLAITVNFISRTVVDWDEVNRVRDKQSEIQDKLKKAKKENDSKKAHKLQKKQQEFMQQHMGTMFSPMKTMLIIIIPFIIVFQLLSSTYGGWVVAWLPFKLPWPDINFLMFSRFFKGPAVSLGFFGWYLLSYFGLSQICRKIIVPGQ